MKRVSRFAVAGFAGAALAALLAMPSAASVAEGPILVVSALYGPAKTNTPVNFADRLAESCGRNVSYCQAFCNRAAAGILGRWRPLFSGRPLCRVVYRCGVQTTRAVEAADNESFTLSCRIR